MSKKNSSNKTQKATGKKVLCFLMLVVMLVTTVTESFANDVLIELKNLESRYTETMDPFETMYDSDLLFIENALEFLNTELLDEHCTDLGEAVLSNLYIDIRSSISADVLSVLEEKCSIKDIGNKQIKELAADRLEEIYIDTREDQYIIKYKEDITEDHTGAFGNVLSSRRIGNIEVIKLNARVNPSELARSLRETGMDLIIEYIQPDFLMSYAMFGLSYIEVEKIDDIEPEDTDDLVALEKQFEYEYQEDADDLSNLAQQEASDAQSLPEDYEEHELSENEIMQEVQELHEKQEAQEEYEEQEPQEEQEDNNCSITKDTIVALIDTGVDINHPQLSEHLISGWNFIDNNANVYDHNNPLSEAHGTHIAGIIASVGGENVKVMPLKVFGPHGAYTSDIIAAIEYAQVNAAKVVNCSFGSKSYNPALYETISNSGMLFVASVGNDRADFSKNPVYPAAFNLDNIISVASVNSDGGFSYYSNYGKTSIDITALGRDVHSTMPNGGYGPMTGTSMAAGQVSGAAATVLAYCNKTAGELKETLVVSADILSNLQNKVIEGRRLNTENALAGTLGDYLELDPLDDFDVLGYQRTPEESWALFSTVDIIDISAGEYHSLALASDGTVWAWGHNDCGQLGDGTTINKTTPEQVIGLSGAVAISAGNSVSYALKSDGTVWAWGKGTNGALGDGTEIHKLTPVQVVGLTNITAISSGTNLQAFAIMSDSTAWAWGFNRYGQLGDGTTANQDIPVLVSELTGATKVSAGISHGIALMSNGTVKTWGYNKDGQLGDGTTTESHIPTLVSGLNNITDVSGGGYSSYALKSDGTVLAWGFDMYGQLGDGGTYSVLAPVQISALSGIIKISTGSYHFFALESNGTLWACGSNIYGQLGDGTTTIRRVPTVISGIINISTMDGGYGFSLALCEDGALYAWGQNRDGQLGNGTTTNCSVPTLIVLPSVPELFFDQAEYSTNIPLSGTTTVQVNATAYDSSGNIIQNASITYSLVSPYSGVNVNSSTGEVTIYSTALPGTVMLKAVYNSLTATTALTVIAQTPLLELSIQQNYEYLVTLSAVGITSFYGTPVLVEYDATKLQLIAITEHVYEANMDIGSIPNTNITVTAISPGSISLSYDKAIPQGKAWSGVITILKFKAIASGITTVNVST